MKKVEGMKMGEREKKKGISTSELEDIVRKRLWVIPKEMNELGRAAQRWSLLEIYISLGDREVVGRDWGPRVMEWGFAGRGPHTWRQVGSPLLFRPTQSPRGGQHQQLSFSFFLLLRQTQFYSPRARLFSAGTGLFVSVRSASLILVAGYATQQYVYVYVCVVCMYIHIIHWRLSIDISFSHFKCIYIHVRARTAGYIFCRVSSYLYFLYKCIVTER